MFVQVELGRSRLLVVETVIQGPNIPPAYTCEAYCTSSILANSERSA